MANKEKDPELAFLSYNWERFLKRVLEGNAGMIWQAAVLSVSENAVLFASDNFELWQDEVDRVTAGVRNKNLQNNMFSVGYKQYVVTSIQGRSYTGRAIDEFNPGGVYISEGKHVIFVATFQNNRNNGFAGQAIPYLIQFAEEAGNL